MLKKVPAAQDIPIRTTSLDQDLLRSLPYLRFETVSAMLCSLAFSSEIFENVFF